MNDLKILYLSSFPPRKCGIANFSQNSLKAINRITSNVSQKVVAVNEMNPPRRNYSGLVVNQFNQEELDSYHQAAVYINESGADLLFLQHEYGLFGGFDGIFILRLLASIDVPIVSFFHSVPVLKTAKRRHFRLQLLKKIGQLSEYVITTAEVGREVLVKECSLEKKKIAVVHHGGYDIDYPSKEEREKIKEKHGLKGRFVVLSYGLITKSKGFGYGLEAVAKLKNNYPQILYLIAGEAHPIHAGLMEKDYYSTLQKKAEKLKIKNNLRFVDRFLKKDELIENLKMADVFLLPY